MLNVIDMYDQPMQIEGVEPGESSDDVLAKYMAYMYPALFSRACHPVMFGTVYVFTLLGLLLQLVGDIAYTVVDPRIDFEARAI